MRHDRKKANAKRKEKNHKGEKKKVKGQYPNWKAIGERESSEKLQRVGMENWN